MTHTCPRCNSQFMAIATTINRQGIQLAYLECRRCGFIGPKERYPVLAIKAFEQQHKPRGAADGTVSDDQKPHTGTRGTRQDQNRP